MTPDTTAYMISGFAVIFGGIAVYVITIITRVNRYHQQASDYEELLEKTKQDRAR